MKKTRKLLTMLLSAAMIGGLLSGCGSSGDSADTNDAATEAAEAEESTKIDQGDAIGGTVTNENVAEGEETEVDVINVGIEADPGELSPFGPSNTGRKDTLNAFYQSLAYSLNGEIVGVMFSDYEIGGDDDAPYLEMHLYDYIHDAAGNAITAEDVKFCLDKGKELGNLADLNIVDSAEVIDDYTVRFNFGHELYLNDIENVFNNLLIVDKDAYEASPDGMATDPVSTSRYQVSNYQPGYCLTLERNDNYWQTDDSLVADRDKGNVKTINYYILTESSKMSEALENGSIDMSWALSTDDIDHITATGKYWLFQSRDDLCDYLFFNCTEGHATSDVNLRTALYYAVNSEVVINSVYGGAAERMYDMAAQKAPDAPDSWTTEENYYQFNLDKAKEYLDKWGGDPASLNLVILGSNDTSTNNEIELMQSFFSAIGVSSELKPVDSAQINTFMDDDTAWDVLVCKNATNAYVPNLWKNLLSAENYAWGGTRNFVYDDELQDIINTARSLNGHSEETVQKGHEYIIENAYGYGLCNFMCNYVVPSNCTDVVSSFKGAILPGGCTYIAQ